MTLRTLYSKLFGFILSYFKRRSWGCFSNISFKNRFCFSILYSCFLLATLGACQKSPPPVINFYHWKAQFNLNKKEIEYLSKLQSQTLYLRLFDVDFHPEKGVVPVGNTQIVDSIYTTAFVGVVFITNRTMLQIKPSKLQDLAQKITKKIVEKTKKMPLKGIQLDCDWSEKSQENFFQLCALVRQICQQKNLELSATIRLHQFKYKKQTGVPPVDRGVLMLYNVGDIDGKNTENSILEQRKVSEYLQNIEKYPLPLSVALPLFRWAVVQRMGKTTHLLSQIEKADIEQNKYIEKIQKNLYTVKENHYFSGVYLYEGDTLRWEEITWESLEKLSEMISLKVATQELIFYHLDSKIINLFPYEKLKNLVNYWH